MRLFSALLPALLLAGCQENSFNQAAYFKDEARNRVFVIEAIAPVTADEIEDNARGQMNTSGQMTIAYYYLTAGHAPADRITRAPDFQQANTMMFEGPVQPWDFRAIHSPNGTFTLIDCRNSGDESNCR